MEFEEALIQSLLQLRNQTKNKNFQTFFNVARGFNDLSDESISTDVSRLVGGISIVYMYVLFMLGGFDCVNQKVNKYLSKLSKENISSNKFLLFTSATSWIRRIIISIFCRHRVIWNLLGNGFIV